MNNHRTQLCFALSLVVILLPLHARADGLTLPGAFARAVRNHPNLLQGQAKLASAAAQIDVARNGFFPTATIDANNQEITPNRAPRVGAAVVPNQVPPTLILTPNRYWSASITAKWNAWDFGRTFAQLDVAQSAADAAAADLRSAKVQLWWTVAAAYVTVFANDAALSVVHAGRDQIARQRDITKQRVDARIRPELDWLKSEADLAAAEGDLLRAEEVARASRVALAAAMGEAQLPQGGLAAAVFESSALPTDLASAGAIEPLLATALERRPEFSAFRARIAAQNAAVIAAQRAIRPNVYINSTVSEAGLELSNLIFNYGFTIGISFPLSTLWTQKPLIADAQAQVRAIEATRDVQVINLRASLNNAATALVQARKRATSVAAQIKYAQAARDAAIARYTAGVGLQLEMADAETVLLRAQLAQVQWEVDLAFAAAQLLWQIGVLPENP